MSNLRKSGQENLEAVLHDCLHEREWQKIRNLLAARDDPSIVKIIRNLVKVIPNSVKPVHRVPQEVLDDIKVIERENRYVRLDLKSGLTLRTFPSRQQYRNYYYCFRDFLPRIVTPESYQGVYDIAFRLNRGDEILRSLKDMGLVAHRGDLNIIECGAYNGWKALGFARHIGQTGKVIALEIDDEQFELCHLNLATNLPKEQFQTWHAGIWHTVEEREYTFEHYASHSLRTPDEHLHHTQTKKIRTETLDNVIDQSGVEVFDFLNIQTGGAELEAVQGLERHLDSIKLMWIGSHYVHDGVSIRYRCVQHLLERGCRIFGKGREEITSVDEVGESETGGIWAVSPKWRDEIVPRAAA